jgi:hypothetical protein
MITKIRRKASAFRHMDIRRSVFELYRYWLYSAGYEIP